VTEREEFVSFMDHMEAGLKKECSSMTREEVLVVVAFALFQENRRTTPDREAIIAAAKVVVREALDDVDVHPCDVHNDDVRANCLAESMRALYLALKTALNGEKEEKS